MSTTEHPDTQQRLVHDNADLLTAGSANIAVTLKKGQQQYSTPSNWAFRFTAQLPSPRPQTVIDWQCGTGALLDPFDRAARVWGVDVDRRLRDHYLARTSMNRIVGSCLSVWDILEEFFPDARFECQVVNPPFGLPWQAKDFKLGRATSTAVTWRRVRHYACEGGYGYFIAGRKQLEALKIHEHPWAYLYQTFPSGFFPGADIEIGVVHWLNGAHPERVHLEFKTLDPNEHPMLPASLASIPISQRVQSYEEGAALHAAMCSASRIMAEEEEHRSPYNLALKGNALSVHFSHRFQLTHKLDSSDLEKLASINGQHPLTLVQEVHTRRLMQSVIRLGVFNISPEADAAIRDALHQAAKMATPIMPVTDFEMVAYADEMDCLTVRQDFVPSNFSWQFSFRPGKRYPHTTGTYTFVEKFQRNRVHYSEEEERTFTLAHQCTLTGQDRFIEVRDEYDKPHQFMDRPDPTKGDLQHPESLLWQIFERPVVQTVAEELAPIVEKNRQRLLALAATMLS